MTLRIVEMTGEAFDLVEIQTVLINSDTAEEVGTLTSLPAEITRRAGSSRVEPGATLSFPDGVVYTLATARADARIRVTVTGRYPSGRAVREIVEDRIVAPPASSTPPPSSGGTPTPTPGGRFIG